MSMQHEWLTIDSNKIKLDEKDARFVEWTNSLSKEDVRIEVSMEQKDANRGNRQIMGESN